MAKFSAWKSSSAQEPSENRLCKRIYQSWDTEDTWLKPHWDNTAPAMQICPGAHRDALGSVGPEPRATTALRTQLLLLEPLQALPKTTQQCNIPWESVTGTNLNFHLHGQWLVLCQEKSRFLGFMGPCHSPVCRNHYCRMERQVNLLLTQLLPDPKINTSHPAFQPHGQKAALGRILLRKRWALEKGLFPSGKFIPNPRFL